MIKNKYGRRLITAGCVVAMAAATVGAIAVVDDAPAGAATTTQKIIVRPVTSHRRAAKGYHVVTEQRSVACTTAAAAAIDFGILACGSSADYTVACWHSTIARRVLCLPDPTKKSLESIRLEGSFPKIRPPAHPRPQALRLANSTTYVVRDGGAASRIVQHPSWVPFYQRGSGSIYGPVGSHGINTAHRTWLVTTYKNANAKGVRHAVTRAYYVGTGS